MTTEEQIGDEDLAFASAVEQARLIRTGAVSATRVIEVTLARIESLNPLLNAYRIVFADKARTEARRIDAAIDNVRELPLLGVPIAIKDDADIEGEITAWGTDAYGSPKTANSSVVDRLRAAGAIIIGKTNVPELTLWPWTSSKTWGITRNPWDTERTPGGSSGGSAIAVATGMCAIALGSDGGGSIRYPAAMTGIFGLKPQRDRIDLGPEHHNAWHGLTVYGPLTRTVTDAAAFLDATADRTSGQGSVGSFVSALSDRAERLRIAVSFDPPPGSLARLTAPWRAAVRHTAELLRSQGHDVFEAEVDYGIRTISNLSVRYLHGLKHDAATMPRRENLDRTTRQLAARARLLPTSTLTRARAKEMAIAARINRVFDNADVVMTPMAGAAPPLIKTAHNKGLFRSLLNANTAAWAGPWNVVGQPAASIPVGFDDDGLPLAIQIASPPNNERTLLRLAAEIEQIQPWATHRPPSMASEMTR